MSRIQNIGAIAFVAASSKAGAKPLAVEQFPLYSLIVGRVDGMSPWSLGFSSNEELPRSYSHSLRDALPAIYPGVARPGKQAEVSCGGTIHTPTEIRRSIPGIRASFHAKSNRGSSQTEPPGPCKIRCASPATVQPEAPPGAASRKSKNIRQCMIISARTAARVPVRDIAAPIVAGVTPPPTPAPLPGRSNPKKNSASGRNWQPSSQASPRPPVPPVPTPLRPPNPTAALPKMAIAVLNPPPPGKPVSPN